MTDAGLAIAPAAGMECRPVDDITVVLGQLERGDASAAERLLPLVYEELRKLAAAKMAKEAPGQTLQPTALVHEVWLRLGGDSQPEWKNRAHFFAAAAETMRRIFIDRARRRQAMRHGGGLVRATDDGVIDAVESPSADDAEILDVHEALEALARHDARKAELVKQCYFVGLTIKEAALVLGISEPTARRGWTYARAWLFDHIKQLRAGDRRPG